ncbi:MULTISPECIES: hypothetical protein [unclassified Streptomyces]|uniref:hypothetical protein n=1 Tax=unclassified Streptomyces TaxID=2593676 RepID=UPI0037F3BC82
MTRRTRTTATAVVLFALAVFGAGCSPAPKGILAVERAEGGGVRLLLASCPGYLAQNFSVLADVPGDTLVNWMVSNTSWTESVGSMRVFGPLPKGWRSASGNLLTELRGGVPYSASVRGSMGNRGLDDMVDFTLADLDGLKDEQVLIAEDGGGNKTVDREDFLRADSDKCEPRPPPCGGIEMTRAPVGPGGSRHPSTRPTTGGSRSGAPLPPWFA